MRIITALVLGTGSRKQAPPQGHCEPQHRRKEGQGLSEERVPDLPRLPPIPTMPFAEFPKLQHTVGNEYLMYVKVCIQP